MNEGFKIGGVDGHPVSHGSAQVILINFHEFTCREEEFIPVNSLQDRLDIVLRGVHTVNINS